MDNRRDALRVNMLGVPLVDTTTVERRFGVEGTSKGVPSSICSNCVSTEILRIFLGVNGSLDLGTEVARRFLLITGESNAVGFGSTDCARVRNF